MKNTRIHFRLTENQKQKIEEKASNANMTISNFVRESVLKKEVKDYSNLLKISREINYIGNNINQAARIMNTYHSPDGSDYNYIIEEFDKLKKFVDEYIGGELHGNT